MRENVVVCAWSGARQPVEVDDDGKIILPHGWIEVPSVRFGGDEETEDIDDLHFVSFEALSHWSASRHLRHHNAGLRARPARTWTSDHR